MECSRCQNTPIKHEKPEHVSYEEWCNNPEKFGGIPLEEAKRLYPHFFKPEDDWRLPTIEDSILSQKA